MKIRRHFIILALLPLLFTGCSKNPRIAGAAKINDLGVIDVSSGKPSSHTLADGRTCSITTDVLPDGNIRLTTRVVETNGSKTLTFEAPADGKAYTFGFDQDTVITLALRR